MTWFDSYDRAARLAPGLLALLPVTVVLIALGLDETPVLSTLGGVLMVAGGPLVLVSLVRARGRLLQNQLFDRWGGPPTTQLLRLRAPSANPIERDRWREALESRSGIPLPSADEEENNPVEADQAYGAVVAWAIEATRGHALLLEENKSYGFLRNALAMRPVGIALAGLGMVVLLMVALVDGWTPGRGIGFVVVALSFGGWLCLADARSRQGRGLPVRRPAVTSRLARVDSIAGPRARALINDGLRPSRRNAVATPPVVS